ncbi:two-component sensor histidine kinase [Nostoc sp. CENA543]|uniref:ATP-binding protein n=1 Tax=Nostoc sp. CENA543 TaxID=1869241 RepID=UPI000CA3A825|nr:ATP-binding protein [Nostoc sp. CENA543]AUT00624.1 two-component sensor histidine kinase [Nostoc sp. CENA543]
MSQFRLRVALLSAALAGGALVGFGFVSWWLIYDAKLTRLNAQLEAQLMRPPIKDFWRFPRPELAKELDIKGEMSNSLLVTNNSGQIIYKSTTWPDELNLKGLFRQYPPLSPSAKVPPKIPPDVQGFLGQHPPPPPPRLPPLRPRLLTQQTKTGTWRFGVMSFPEYQVAIAVSLQTIDREMNLIRDVFVIAIPVLLFLVSGGAWIVSGNALNPIRQLVVAIRQVTATGLDQRIPIGATDVEFMELIQVFNQMLERLKHSFKQASRFSGDAAHELKTPLAILQGELERSLQQAEPGSEMQQSLGNLLDEVRRLSGIVRKLLLLSLADAGQMSLHRVEVDISQMLVQMLEDIELLAPHLQVEIKITPGLQVDGDRDLLNQVLQNLLSNAIKYNLPEGWIQIEARQRGKIVYITISNASQDIPIGDRDRLFERFYRGDLSRNRKVDGTGLGLSLAREITIAHGGELYLEPTVLGQTAFTLRLPNN